MEQPTLDNVKEYDPTAFRFGVGAIYFGFGATILPFFGAQFRILPLGQAGFFIGPALMVIGAVIALRNAKDPRDVFRHLWTRI